MRLPDDHRRTRIEHALDHALKDHVNVIPLIRNTKLPALKNWPAMGTQDEKTLLAWWKRDDFNIGIVGGSTKLINGVVHYLLIVDYDMKPGQLGHEALLDHERRGLANTRTIKTPNGVHKVFWSKTLFANSQGKLAPNVDVRCRHGYVVASGSTIEDNDYVVTDPREIAVFPDELAALLSSGNSGNGAAATHDKRPIGELDQPHSIQLVRDYLQHHAPEALQGQHGDSTTYQVAARCKDMGVSEEQCFDMMLDYWNADKASPPWAYDALRTKVTNAYRYGQNAPGSVNPLNEFELIDGPILTKDQPNKGLYRVSYRERVNLAGKSHSHPLIKGLLKRGTLNVLYGPSNSGKTFVVLDMAYAIGLGIPWNGLKTTKGLVIYVAAEGGPGVNERTKALDMVRKPASDPLFDVVPCPIDLLRGNGPDSDTYKLVALIKAAEKEYGQPCVLVVIDTLSRALAGGEENSSVDMGTFVKHIDHIRAATGAAALVIHHSGKDIARGARGWSGVQAAIDTEIEIAENTFKVTKQRDLPTIDELSFDLQTVQVGIDEDNQPIYSCTLLWGAAGEFNMELSRAEQRVFDLLEAEDQKTPIKEITRDTVRGYAASAGVKIGTDDRTLAEHLDTLAAKTGRIKKTKKGVWEWLPKPEN